jgi:hypothetical protein
MVFTGPQLLRYLEEPTVWIAGGDGDANQAWSAQVSSQYISCSSWDLCDASNAFDGVSDVTANDTMRMGASFAFNGLLAPPHWMDIDLGREISLVQWSFRPSGGCSYNAKRVSLFSRSTASSAPSQVANATINIQQINQPFLSAMFPPVSARYWRITVDSVFDCASNPSSVFQVYIREVMFNILSS